MKGAGAMQPANAELRKPEIEAQFVSFNFTNALICVEASSALLHVDSGGPTIGRRLAA